MSEINSILNNLNQFKDLLIENDLFDAKSLSELLTTTEEKDSETQFKLIIENIESRDQKQIEKFASIVFDSQLVGEEVLTPTDQSDSHPFSLIDLKSQLLIRFKELLRSQKDFGEELIVQKSNKIKSNKYGDVYPMTSRPRGYCIIIDNQLFRTLPYRTGSRADADRLCDIFSQLYFDVLRYTNKTSDQIKTLLYNFSINPMLAEHDALAVIILSHGCKDGIYGSDDDLVDVDSILEYFNNENCRPLRNKPKMFFLSACRGAKIDPGANSMYFSTARSLGKSMLQSDTLPTWSDIFVYYSSISGYASLRNTNTGSWFGYELAHGLAEYAHREHLHDLITIKVGEKLQNRITEVNGNSAKQSIETQTKGSVKKVYFNPGLTKTDKK